MSDCIFLNSPKPEIRSSGPFHQNHSSLALLVKMLQEAMQGGRVRKAFFSNDGMSALLLNNKTEPALSPKVACHAPSELWFWWS